jgi:ubiquinone/menaquinone biosynthesis C-methylase UbiE
MRKDQLISKERWDEIYKKGVERVECTLEVDEQIPWIAELFEKHHVKKILDLGCGAGRHTIYLSQKGFDVYGIDISGEGIKKAHQQLAKKHLHANLIVGSVYNPLPYPDDSFDAIVSTRTLYHAKIEEIRKAIKEIERVLKPHGLVFITVRRSNLKKKHLHSKEIAPRTYVPMGGKEKGAIHYIFNKNLLRREFKNFKIYEIWVDSKNYYCLLGELTS